jgi:hypothetical protein
MKNELLKLKELLDIPTVKSFSESNKKFNKQFGKYTLESFKKKANGDYFNEAYTYII